MRLISKVALFVVAGALTATSAPAFADSDAASVARSSGVATHGPVNASSDAATYWTRERMASAIPVESTLPAGTTGAEQTAEQIKVAVGTPGRVAPSAPAAMATRPGQAGLDSGAFAQKWRGDRYSPPATTSGKVFFVADDGLNYVCSGSTINSAGKNLVFTAGHCVHGQGASGSWYDASTWIFVPDYNGKGKVTAPYGMWTASQLWSLSGWTQDGDRAYDIGVAVMQTDGFGTHIVNAVGGQGIEWNWPLEQFVYQFGYPQRAPFLGNRLQYCTGNTYNDSGFEGINCNMTEGASGGPWLDGFDGTFGWLDSVNSWVFWDGGGVRYKWNGPYFGDAAANLYNAVANL